MKKITVILVALLLTCAMSALSFAETATGSTAVKKPAVAAEMVRGKIVSIDTTNNEIVVKENKTGTDKTIVVDPTVISTLKVADQVRVTLKAGSNNVAEKVRKIIKPAGTPKKTQK